MRESAKELKYLKKVNCNYLTGHLYLTYLLSHCDTRCEVNVRQSAFRGLGMIVTFDFALTDPNFLLDCADKICSAMEQRCSKNIAVNVTWALSNLCDALLLLHSQNLDVFYADYPKCEIVKILAETTKYTAEGVQQPPHEHPCELPALRRLSAQGLRRHLL